jgi:hypothetical protein
MMKLSAVNSSACARRSSNTKARTYPPLAIGQSVANTSTLPGKGLFEAIVSPSTQAGQRGKPPHYEDLLQLGYAEHKLLTLAFALSRRYRPYVIGVF